MGGGVYYETALYSASPAGGVKRVEEAVRANRSAAFSYWLTVLFYYRLNSNLRRRASLDFSFLVLDSVEMKKKKSTTLHEKVENKLVN
jgi:hypothetical protein